MESLVILRKVVFRIRVFRTDAFRHPHTIQDAAAYINFETHLNNLRHSPLEMSIGSVVIRPVPQTSEKATSSSNAH